MLTINLKILWKPKVVPRGALGYALHQLKNYALKKLFPNFWTELSEIFSEN